MVRTIVATTPWQPLLPAAGHPSKDPLHKVERCHNVTWAKGTVLGNTTGRVLYARNPPPKKEVKNLEQFWFTNGPPIFEDVCTYEHYWVVVSNIFVDQP